MKSPKTHPDDVVNEMLDVATKHGYGVEYIRLMWVSGTPQPEVVRIGYRGKDQDD